MASGEYEKTQEHKEKVSKSLKGKHVSVKTEFKNGHDGYPWSEEAKEKLSEDSMGIKNNNWKGGISDINLRIRQTKEYKLWRIAVLERDDNTCVWCGSKEDIQTDHIKPFALFPELRFAIDNGRVLCKRCHKTTDTYAGKLNNNGGKKWN